MSSNKKLMNNCYKGKNTIQFNNNAPKKFFRSIGLKPYVKENEEGDTYHFEKVILNKFGKETLTLFEDALNAPEKGEISDLCHTRLDFVKIWYGVGFYKICLIANILQKLNITNIKNVLDIGGGPGHMAFFMSKLWPGSNITVFDKHSHLGKEWANEINECRVDFKNGQLSDFQTIEGCNYDLIIMSRVLGNLEDLDLPSYTNTFDTPSYLESQKGKDILEGLVEIGISVKKHMTDEGHLVIIDSWSSTRALLVAKAFEKAGLYIDIEHFDPEEVSKMYSTIVFSKYEPTQSSQDLPLGLAVITCRQEIFKSVYVCSGHIAEVYRSLFTDSKTIFESLTKIDNTLVKQEVLEKNGIAMRYLSDTGGLRTAAIGSSLFVPLFVNFCEEHENELKSYPTQTKL